MFQEALLQGKKILVTGGGTGLGKAMVEHYLSLGAELVICGRRKAVLEETAGELAEKTGGTITFHQCDIRDGQAVGAMIDEIWRTGPLTGLVNNAAGNFISRTEDLSPGGFDAIANIVLHGTFYVTNACAKRWIAAGDKGNVISIVVTWVWTGSAFVAPSAMAKAGIAAMTRSLAVEWGPKGIRLNAVAPGSFPTPGASTRLNPEALGFSRDQRLATIPLRRDGELSELTNLMSFLMADGCDYLTGQIIAIDGGQWLNTAGSFGHLAELTDADWTNIRREIMAANAREKSERGS